VNKIVKRSLLAGAVVALMASAAWSHGPWDGGPGYGMGPGMMGGYGGGPGMMGGYGGGPGMMGGYGGGPGMMGGYGGGPGMMGGYGGGPGMMGGYGGGPGMMGGYGGPGMGRGGWGLGGYGALDLTPEQRSKIGEIQDEFGRQQWALMSRMHDEGLRENQALRRGDVDENAARKAYDEMAAVRKQMFENSLQMRKRIDEVVTPEQRQKLGR